MSLFAIGDLHLSLSADKSMHVFDGWDNYVERIKLNWEKLVKETDTVVLVGDSSWGMSLEQSKEDFNFINNLPGKKIILKGNHDYWWTTKAKMESFFCENNFSTLEILHNNHFIYEDIAICGTRGWINETEEPADAKVLKREASRLVMSIESVFDKNLSPVVFLHYPPIFADNYNYEILEVLYKYNIKECYYGHIHGKSKNYSINGERDGISFSLISSDYLQFIPKKIR